MTFARLTAAAAALAFVAGACGGPAAPTAGYVRDRQFTPAHDDYTPPLYIPEHCTFIDETIGTTVEAIDDCTPPLYIPGSTTHYDDTWSLLLDDGKRKGWRDVPAALYVKCRDEEWCDTRTPK